MKICFRVFEPVRTIFCKYSPLTAANKSRISLCSIFSQVGDCRMGAVKQLANKKVLKNLIPLNPLTSSSLQKIAHKAVIEEVRAGRFVFKQGDRDNHTVYLLQ